MKIKEKYSEVYFIFRIKPSFSIWNRIVLIQKEKENNYISDLKVKKKKKISF